MDIKLTLDSFLPDWLKRLYNFFSAVPANVEVENYWFYNISNLAYFLISLLHLSWIVVFFVIGQKTMLCVQIPSIFCYFIALYFNRKGQHVLAMVIGLVEVNLHQALAVVLLGWGTGFQNFIPLIALLPFLKYNESWLVKFGLGAGCMLCYLSIDKFVKNALPLRELSAVAADFLNFSNSVLCFLLVALWGIVLAISYQRAVSALIKKEQELFASQKANEQAEIIRELQLKDRDNEIYQLRNIELKNSNVEITEQKKVIEELVAEQEKIIRMRTLELQDANIKLIQANKKLLELIQYNSHYLREPLARVMGGMSIHEDVGLEEFYNDVWPQIDRAVHDLDRRIIDVIKIAEETVELYS